MYNALSQISAILSKPFFAMANSLESFPLVFALLLGLVGALAPCQLTGNISAVTLYGNRSIQRKIAGKDVLFFTLGKIAAFSFLGVLVWWLGKGVEQNLILYFPWLRKLMGPLLILVGLFLVGVIQLKRTFTLFNGSKPYSHENPFGSFMLGFSFSLAFCPTMFVLFFVTLMPIVLSSPYGFILPTVFALGTAIPLWIVIFIIWFLGGSGMIMKKGRKFGSIVQRVAGVFMIVIGFFDTLIYWTL